MAKPWNFQSFSNQQCLNWSFRSSSSDLDHEDYYKFKDQQNINFDNQRKKRQSHKNKYVNKIKECLPEQTYHTHKKIQNKSEISVDPLEMKKFKNREAAKESRERKKIYIALVEQQTRKLENEIELTNKQIQKCKLQIHGNNFNGNQYLSTFNRKMHHIIKKLQKLISVQENQEINNEINLSIDSILYRFGPNGKERNAYIKDGFKQIISLCLPHINKYIGWSARQQVHMFSKNQNKRSSQTQLWFSPLQDLIASSFQGKEQFLQNQRTNIVKKLQEILQAIIKFYLKNKDISALSSQIDNTFLQIREMLTPFQATKFIMFIEKYKYRQQLRIADEEEKDTGNHLGKPKKHIKVQSAEENFFQ